MQFKPHLIYFLVRPTDDVGARACGGIYEDNDDDNEDSQRSTTASLLCWPTWTELNERDPEMANGHLET